MVRKRKSGEDAIVGNEFEEVRPCFNKKGGDVCAKLIYAVLSKYNPAIPNDKYNDLQRVDHETKHLPKVGFNEAEVDYIFSISSSYNPTLKKRPIRNAITKLISEKITVKKADGGIIACPIFTLLNYTPSDKTNTLVAEINYNLLELVLDFKNINKLYTTVSLNDIRLLSSDYAIKIYTYCQRYSKVRNDDCYEMKIEADKLRILLGIPKGYLIKDINRKILDKYTEEISKKTSFVITWKGELQGRKLVNYKFFVKAKTPTIIRKEYNHGFAGKDIDNSLINPDNVETVAYLTKKGVNKKQLIEVIKKGTSYLKYVTEKIDSQYAKLTSDDMAYYDNEKQCYCSFIDNRPIMYGALFWGAVKGWLNYDKWAQEHEEDVKRDQARLIELSNIKMHEAEEVAKERERKEKREYFRTAIPSYKNLSDEQLDRIIDTAEAMNQLNKEAEEAEKQKKANENNNNEEKAVKEIVVDSFARANFDVAALSLSPFKDFFFDEQKRLGFDDFAEFVQYVKKGFINSM